jgi:BMFP domain-containing protein YqiC
MSKSSKIFEDMAELAGGAAGLLNDLQQQMREDVRGRMEEMATRLDLVPREELERVEALLQKTIERQDQLGARLSALEKGKKP